MSGRDTYGRRHIERVISRQDVSGRDELERAVRAVVTVRCDIELIEDSLGAGGGSIEAGSPAWERLCRALVGSLVEDARESASVLGSSASEVLYDAWRCLVQDAEEEGREPSPFVKAAVELLADALRHDGRDLADITRSLCGAAAGMRHAGRGR